MSTRKSLSRKSRVSRAADDASPLAAVTTEAPPLHEQEQPVASSSKVKLDMPPLDVPESITWDYEPQPREPQALTKDQKEEFIQELMQFSPYHILQDISEHARQTIYPTVTTVEGWARNMAADRREYDIEVDRGSHALETLLENHIDRAFDKYTAYALRNAFSVPDGIELVLPWQQGADFDRAKFVNELEGQEDVLVQRIAALRSKVEQARYVNHRLAHAEAVLDKRLQIAAHRRAEVGFVRDSVAEAGLTPLDGKAQGVVDALSGLHSNLDDVKMQPRTPGVPAGVAWETGRQAYLSWAVGKALSGGREGEVSADRLDGIERENAQVGTEGDLEELSKAARK